VNSFGLFALTQRRNDLVHAAKFMGINSMKPITKGKNGFKGGLEDIGNFKEGFCFKVVSSKGETWIICADD